MRVIWRAQYVVQAVLEPILQPELGKTEIRARRRIARRGELLDLMPADLCTIVCPVAAAVPRKHPKLARAPLVNVVCQVRFPPVFALSAEGSKQELLAALQRDLSDYPLFAQVVGQEILLGPEGVQAQEPKPTSFRFSSDDELWNIGLSLDSLSLQTTQYEHFNDLVERWRAIALAVQTHLAPARQLRIGLRYIDELRSEGADRPDKWRELLAPELLGLAASETWGSRTSQSFQEWVLEVGAVRCTLRHGFLPTGVHGREPFYLLDTDCYVEEVTAFDPEAQLKHLDQFNDLAYQLFRDALAEPLYEGFEPEATGE